MKLLLFEQFTSNITIYHGGGINKTKCRLKYYSDNYKYANWFANNNSYNTGIVDEIKINPHNFLDLTKYGFNKNITSEYFKEILKNNNIYSPYFVDENITNGLGKIKYYMWQFFTEPNPNYKYYDIKIQQDFDLFINDISSKYDGIIILEKNPEALYLGISTTYIIDTKTNL